MNFIAATLSSYSKTLLAMGLTTLVLGHAVTFSAEGDPPKAITPRQPVPSGQKVTDAEKLTRDLLKEEYQKRGVAERVALAKQLMTLAEDCKDDPNSHYVVLREAKDVALAVGEMEIVWSACDQLSKAFALDPGELKTTALTTLGRGAVAPEVAEKALEGGQALLDQYLNESQFDAALKLMPPLEDLARKANNPDLLKSIQSRTKDIRSQQTDWARVKPAFDKLKENPNDAEAALIAGKFYISPKANWEQAVKLLAKCSSPPLQQAAEKELTEPAQPEARADVGDLWWMASEKETGAMKSAMQQRALNWYQQAVEGLVAPRKQQVEKRVQSVVNAGTTLENLKASGLVFCVYPSLDPTGRDVLSGASPKNVGAITVVMENGIRALKMNETYSMYPASEPVKAVSKTGSAFVWFRMDKSVGQYNAFLFKGVSQGPKSSGRTDFTIMTNSDKVINFFNWPEVEWPGTAGKTAFYSKRAAPLGKWTMCGMTWDGTTVTVYMNGEREASYKVSGSPTPSKHGDESIVGLGCDPAGANQTFIGLMGGAMIFNRALTEAEVKQIYTLSGIQGK